MTLDVWSPMDGNLVLRGFYLGAEINGERATSKYPASDR